MEKSHSTALDRAVQHCGGVTKLATALDLRQSVVSNWRARESVIDAVYCTAIDAMPDSPVRRWDLRPDDWHRIWPELVGTEGSPVLPEEPAVVAASDTKPEPRNFHLGDPRRLAMNTFRAIRESLGVTQAEMGAVLGVSQGNVSFYEKGQTVPPTVAAKLIEFSRSKGKVLSYDDVYRVETSDPSAGPET